MTSSRTSDGMPAGRNVDYSRGSNDGTGVAEGLDRCTTDQHDAATSTVAIENAVENAKKTADELVGDHCKGGSWLMGSSQVHSSFLGGKGKGLAGFEPCGC